MEPINPDTVLFIKLGEAGIWERASIEKEHTLRVGFTESDHDDCLHARWNRVRKNYVVHFREKGRKNSEGEATKAVNQLKRFYEEPSTTLWITFYGARLWWCFSEAKVSQRKDGTKVRPVVGEWKSTNILGKELLITDLRGTLTKVQGFRGTICGVSETEYAIKKINGEETENVIKARDALGNLESRISDLITQLNWRDFEILIDLLFRQAGYQRMAEIGRTQKALDLALISPVTNERIMVQVKSQSNVDEFEECSRQFQKMTPYQAMFYVVHSPNRALLKVGKRKSIHLLDLGEVARLSVRAGLSDWIISKSA